jgi:lysozyme family protein
VPGMEVFTISGPALGANYSSLPNYNRAGGHAATSSSSAAGATPAVRLQNALKALGAARGDSNLNIAVDGAIGPGTVKALNYALANVIGAGPVASLGPRFQHAQATKGDVQNYAATLAQIVTQAVQNAGGSVPPPPSVLERTRAGSSRVAAAAQQAMTSDPTNAHPNMVYYIAGGALLVVALGFMAARRRAA